MIFSILMPSNVHSNLLVSSGPVFQVNELIEKTLQLKTAYCNGFTSCMLFIKLLYLLFQDTFCELKRLCFKSVTSFPSFLISSIAIFKLAFIKLTMYFSYLSNSILNIFLIILMFSLETNVPTFTISEFECSYRDTS